MKAQSGRPVRIGQFGGAVRWVAATMTAAVLIGAPAAGTTAAGGTVIGVVTTAVAARPDLRITIDPTVCGATLPDESVVVDRAGRLSGVVATATGVAAPAPAEAVVVNEHCRFLPHVSLLRPKGTVRMASRDQVMHTMHAANTAGKALFNLSLPIPNITLSRPVEKPGAVTVSCSTHTWMRGYLFVTDELSAISGVDGSFRLDGVPAGVREIRFWHEALGAAPIRVDVRDGETTTVAVTLAKP